MFKGYGMNRCSRKQLETFKRKGVICSSKRILALGHRVGKSDGACQVKMVIGTRTARAIDVEKI